ncbi:rhodanese-like domain-containing protein [Pendulispora albinea]|uniref:Rhodanese-like domain-containing protein n=1 Tax=Pendulispora albinea TaxID=2741071 RepID=A0ABZ2M096_9BACT
MSETEAQKKPRFSFLFEIPPAPAEEAHRHFLGKLAFETDPADVHLDVTRETPGLAVVDVRSAAAFEDMHIPGSLNLPGRSITETSAAALRGKLVVVYCWSISCNGSTRAAARLSGLGIQVKEMIGGLDAWLREGYPVEGALPKDVSFDDYSRWHHAGNTGRFERRP